MALASAIMSRIGDWIFLCDTGNSQTYKGLKHLKSYGQSNGPADLGQPPQANSSECCQLEEVVFYADTRPMAGFANPGTFYLLCVRTPTKTWGRQGG